MAIALLLGAATARATTLIVTNPGDSGVGTLRQAILNASPSGGDTINFVTGLPTINLVSGELLIDKNVTINGPGANLLTVQCGAAAGFRIFHIDSASITATISGLTIANGTVFDNGGGIFNSGTLAIISCSIADNRADTLMSAGDGGGIYNAGVPTIASSTISGNGAGDGGGISNTGSLTVTNSTICSNSAFPNVGGGIFNSGTLTIASSTIAGNLAGTSGGGIGNNGTVISRNNIIADNLASCIRGCSQAAGADLAGSLTSQGFNLVGNIGFAMITSAQSSDQLGITSLIDPKLGPLQDNAGSTFTRALLLKSPAINKGDPSAPPTDQRGFSRNGVPDIGAFEFVVVPTVLGNISTRGVAQTGDNVLIGGFIIGGNGHKSLLLRAIGPSLGAPPIDLAGTLQDPTLSLFDSAGTLINVNDNWAQATNAQSIPPTLQPTNALESALLVSLAPGAYTAIVRSANGSTGIALVEAYDMDSAAGSKLANVSTRGNVGTDNDVLIGGFVMNGPNGGQVVVRAIGPSLSNPLFHILNALQDPTLALFDGNGTSFASNDNWRSTQQADIIATGLQPANDAESGIVMVLPPGNYSAIVRGVNGTTGVALVEVYGLN